MELLRARSLSDTPPTPPEPAPAPGDPPGTVPPPTPAEPAPVPPWTTEPKASA